MQRERQTRRRTVQPVLLPIRALEKARQQRQAGTPVLARRRLGPASSFIYLFPAAGSRVARTRLVAGPVLNAFHASPYPVVHTVPGDRDCRPPWFADETQRGWISWAGAHSLGVVEPVTEPGRPTPNHPPPPESLPGAVCTKAGLGGGRGCSSLPRLPQARGTPGSVSSHGISPVMGTNGFPAASVTV